MTHTPKKPDFSNVQPGIKPDFSSVQTQPPPSRAKRADFGNVQSTVGSSEQPLAGGGGGSRPVHLHTVAKGETLSHIAQKHYGKASRWQALFEANRDVIDDPDRIFPGQVLKVPALDD